MPSFTTLTPEQANELIKSKSRRQPPPPLSQRREMLDSGQGVPPELESLLFMDANEPAPPPPAIAERAKLEPAPQPMNPPPNPPQAEKTFEPHAPLQPEPIPSAMDANYVQFGSDLPTKYAFYGTDKIYGRPFMGLDQHTLLQITRGDPLTLHKAFDTLFVRRILGVHPGDIMTADELFFAMWLRRQSFPSKPIPCDPISCDNKKCKGKQPPVTDIDPSQVRYALVTPLETVLSEATDPKGGVKIAELKSTGMRVGIRLKRRRHVLEALDLIRKMTETPESVRDMTEGLEKAMCDDVANVVKTAALTDLGNGLSLYARARLIATKFTAMERLELTAELSRFALVPKTEIVWECPLCGKEVVQTDKPFRWREQYIPRIDSR